MKRVINQWDHVPQGHINPVVTFDLSPQVLC